MTSKFLGRLALVLGAVLLATLFAWEAFSAELAVVQVYRPITLTDDEPSYRDFYINGGANEGLKKNLVVSVIRKMDMKDATGTQAYGEMYIPIGQLRVLFVGPKVSIAREYKAVSFESSPVFEQPGIQIGDKVDLKASFVDNKKVSPHNKTAEARSQPIVPAAVIAQTDQGSQNTQRSPSAAPEIKPGATDSTTKSEAERTNVKPEVATKSASDDENPPLKDETIK